MRTVVILQRVLARHRIPFYNLLRDELLQNKIQLRVIYGNAHKTEELKHVTAFLDWGTEIKNYYLLGGLVWQSCWSLLSKQVSI